MLFLVELDRVQTGNVPTRLFSPLSVKCPACIRRCFTP
jgi:hypothetical protein